MLSQLNSRPFRPAGTPSATSAPATHQVKNPKNCQAKPQNLFPNPQVQQPQMGMVNPQASNSVNGPNNPMQQQNGAPNAQQVNPNNCQPNLFPNPQIQPQMGMVNPQASNPFNGPNIPMQQQNGAANAQQVAPNFQGNQPNMFPNSQIQSQMGMLNPQMPMLFNNFGTPMFNGYGMPMMGNPQNGFMIQMNPNQPFNQLFAPNLMNNFPMCQNAGFPMQNMNQFAQRPLSNFNQASPCNVAVYPNQFPQVIGPQNPNFIPNTQFGMVPNNVVMQPNGQCQPNLVNNVVQGAQGNTMVQPNFQLGPPQKAQNGSRPPVSNISQGNCMNNNGTASPQGKWNNQNGNFSKNNKREGLQKGFQKNRNMQNGKGKVGSQFKHEVKGYQGQKGQKTNFASSLDQNPVQPKKKLSLHYTAQEVQQWREERKRNHPSRAKTEKKHGESTAESEENERIAKLRRQELKEILEQQAKLGVEVADIPSHYLHDSEKQSNGGQENTKEFNKRERFQKNKFNKRGRHNKNDRFPKKQKFTENESPNIHNENNQLHLNKREPTLLQKLLSADIKKDRTRLLQVFRFMTINSFFKDWPKTPLSFPLVMVNEGAENGVPEIKDNDENNYYVNNGSSDVLDDKAACLGNINCILEGENERTEEEEEGEIVD